MNKGIIELKKLDSEFNILINEYETKYNTFINNYKDKKNSKKYREQLITLQGKISALINEIKNKTMNILHYNRNYNKDVNKNINDLDNLHSHLTNVRNEIKKHQEEYISADGKYNISNKYIREKYTKLYLWLGLILFTMYMIYKIK